MRLEGGEARNDLGKVGWEEESHQFYLAKPLKIHAKTESLFFYSSELNS